MSDQGQQQQNNDQGQKPWYDGADAEIVGHIQNRGLDKKTAAEAAISEIKAYREAQKHLGAPPDQIVRLPKDASDEAGRKALYAKLGVPTDGKDYDFSTVKNAAGEDVDAAFTDALRSAFLENGVPKDKAPSIAKSFVKYLDDKAAGDTAVTQGKMQQEADELLKSWGANVKTNTFIANQAAEKLGLSKDVLDALTKVAGRTATAQALLKIGQMMGEDKFISDPGNRSGLLTREQAQAKLKELETDNSFQQRLFSGDVRARQELDGLTRLTIS